MESLTSERNLDVDLDTEDGASVSLQELFFHFLKEIGEQPDREGLQKTWEERAPELWSTLTEGYDEDEKPEMTSFDSGYDGLVVKSDIPVYSICEHHLLPFSGSLHVGYLPDGKILGLSKIIRYARWKSRKLQTQERLTEEIGEGLHQEIDPEGTMVVLEANHFCEAMRGVEIENTTTLTTCELGDFSTDSETSRDYRQDFLKKLDLEVGQNAETD